MTRREFLEEAAGAAAGIAFVGCALTGAPPVQAQARRREVVVSGRRVKTVDAHAHCAVPEAMALMGRKVAPETLLMSKVSDRISAMDEQGIDVEALSINAYWYKADRDVARQLIRIQNEKLAEICAAHPERFVAFASVALQYPDLAAEQLEEGVKKYGLRGAGIGGSVNGEELADPKFHPFWAKAEQLGVLVFIHPQADGAPAVLEQRLKGSGGLGNIIGNPLETTIALSHLIFEGTLDQFPGLKICSAHGGGYLPSYVGRSDAGVRHRSRPVHQTAQEEALGVPPPALLRLARLHARGVTPPRRGDRLEPDRHRHRLSVPVDEDGGGPHPGHARPDRRRPRGDARWDGREAPRDQSVAEAADLRRLPRPQLPIPVVCRPPDVVGVRDGDAHPGMVRAGPDGIGAVADGFRLAAVPRHAGRPDVRRARRPAGRSHGAVRAARDLRRAGGAAHAAGPDRAADPAVGARRRRAGGRRASQRSGDPEHADR